MRRRIVWSTAAVAMLTIVLCAAPLAFAVGRLLQRQALDTLEAEAEQVAVIVQRSRTRAELALWFELLAQRSDARFTLLQPPDRVLADTGGDVPLVLSEAVTGAAGGRATQERLGSSLVAAVPVSSGVAPGLVLRAARPDGDLEAATTRAWVAIAVGSLAVLGLAAGAAAVQGQRLAAPLEALARSARRLGEGDFTARAPRSGLPEIDAIAEAQDTTADRLGRALDRGTAFAADASHQLRTPLTALRLQLEATGGDDPAVAAALAEADRLEATIDELVALTRPEVTDVRVDLAALVRDRADSWARQLAARGRRLEVRAVGVPDVRARAAALGQAAQVLVDNAQAHGRGQVTVTVDTVRWPEGGGARGVRVCVLDEGPGLPPDLPATTGGGSDRGTTALGGGRGLFLARALVAAEGGRLTTVEHDGVVFPCLLVPAAE